MRSLPTARELYWTTRTRPSGYCAGCGKFTQLDPALAECAECILAWYAAQTDGSTRTQDGTCTVANSVIVSAHITQTS